MFKAAESPRPTVEDMTDLVPDDDAATLEALKQQVHAARYQAQRRVNTELMRLYWRIGSTIVDRQLHETWGAKVIDRLAADLRAEFPSMKGFSRANLFYMRRVAEAWPEEALFVQQAAGQLPWTHLTLILDKLDDQQLRDWYAAKAVHHGWTRAVLTHQLTTRLHEREAAAPSNFAGALENADSGLAQEITKDPYALDFLAIDDRLRIHGKHQPTIGILLVADKSDTVVRYALAGSNQPMAVSRYQLAPEAQKALPDEQAIARVFADELAREADRDVLQSTKRPPLPS